MRVVLDTNVLFASFASRGLCEALVAVCLDAHEIISSEYILNELARHLSGKLGMTDQQVREHEVFLRTHATLVEPVEVSPTMCEDADDLPVLGTAVAANAEILVTGDAALLQLGKVHGIPIVSPRQFYDRLIE